MLADARVTTAVALQRDAFTLDVIAALNETGVEGILLKGPVLARLLYADGTPRGYRDIDVLVAPDQASAAGDVLTTLGFDSVFGAAERHQPGLAHAETWRRPDGETVDLHVTLHGCGIASSRVWGALRATARTETLFGRPVLVPGHAAVALHAMTHAAQAGGHPDDTPIEDLRRAIDVIGEGDWRQAGQLARNLGAVPTCIAGLAAAGEPGRAMTERLGFTMPMSGIARLQAEQSPALAIGITHIRAARRRERWRLLYRYALPSNEYIRTTFHVRRNGRLPLVWAHARRLVRHLCDVPATLRAFRL